MELSSFAIAVKYRQKDGEWGGEEIFRDLHTNSLNQYWRQFGNT